MYPSGSLILNIWKRTVEYIHLRARLFSHHASNCSACPASSVLGVLCLITPTYSIDMKKVVSSRMHSSVPSTSWWRYMKSPLMLKKCIYHFLLRPGCALLRFHLAQGFRWRAFRRVEAEEDRRAERLARARKESFSLECDFLVLEPFNVNIGADRFSKSFQSAMGKSTDNPLPHVIQLP